MMRLRNGCGVAEPAVPRIAVDALREDSAGNLWIGTAGQALLRYKSGSLTAYSQTDRYRC